LTVFSPDCEAAGGRRPAIEGAGEAECDADKTGLFVVAEGSAGDAAKAGAEAAGADAGAAPGEALGADTGADDAEVAGATEAVDGTVAEFPGETGDAAAEVLSEPAGEAPSAVLPALDSALKESFTTASKSLLVLIPEPAKTRLKSCALKR
jgi:hypothetical protein